ncbi:MAG: IS1595 family transposase [Rhodospirillaceae bacterium]|nr:IS1595 family transposase [Rhodospirillaceae bacterium]
MLDMSNPIYSNETAAREHLEGIRWADGVYCPHCGGFDGIKKLGGAAAEKGLWHCTPCRKKFTVTVGTVFERSHIGLTKWLAAFHLMCASKKGVSAHQGHRMLGVTYKTAWFMWHRIREAMKRGGVSMPPMGGKGKVVEADETYFGELPEHKAPIRSNPNRPKFGPTFKRAIVSLVERGGQVRSFYAETAKVETVAKIVRDNIDKESRLHTDESMIYRKVGREFASHERVNHGKKEYARGDVTTNTIEGVFSVFKRGMRGTYQHCDERHLHRYLAEFDFRFNNRSALGVDDNARTTTALKGVSGKRLTYQQAR